MKPITPAEVVSHKLKLLPEGVIKVFNDMIAENWTGTYSRFSHKKVMDRICAELGCTIQFASEMHYTDVENIFMDAGWDVTYNRPSYDESFEPYYTFELVKK